MGEHNLVVVMNYQSRKTFTEAVTPLVGEKEQKPQPELTEAQKERAERIKSALNRSARERRMAAHR